jgi:sugar phosphate isomerase/epimerase
MDITRREFLHGAAGAAAVAAVRRQPRADAMFVSLNGALTAGKAVGWPEFPRLAARTGYGGVDVSLDAAETAGLGPTKALFDELKIRPTIVNLPMARPLPFGGEDSAFKDALTKLADHAGFMAAIGCPRMMVVLPASATQPKDEFRKIVRDRMASIAGVLRESNVRIGLEFLGVQQFRAPRPDGQPSFPFIWTLPDTLALAADCGPNVGVILDAWHWHHSGGTTTEIRGVPKSRLVHVHVSDAKPMRPEDVRDNMRVMPGEGSIDLVGFFQALKAIGYTDGVSPEPLGRIPAEMSAEDAARLGLETTLTMMRKAGVL